MPFIVNYQIKRYQNGVKYSSILNFFMDKPSFRFRFQVGKVRGNFCCSQFDWVIVSHFNYFGGLAFFKDRLNFYEKPLKIIGFCKQCFDKLHALLKSIPFTVNYQIKSYQDSTCQYCVFRSNPIFMVRLQVANVK